MTQLSFNFGGREHTVDEQDATHLLRNLARVQARQGHCRLGITEEMVLDSNTQEQYNLFLEQRDYGDENDYHEKQLDK